MRGLLFFACFVIGTIIAAFGWLASWQHVDVTIGRMRIAPVIAVLGHLLQLIAIFAYLLTPNVEPGVEEEADFLEDDYWRNDDGHDGNGEA